MNAVAFHNFRSRRARFQLSRHVSERQERLRFMLECLYRVMKRLKREGYVRRYRIHGLNSRAAKEDGCNCEFVANGHTDRPKMRFGVPLSRRVFRQRQAKYPHTPQLLLRYAGEEVLYIEVLSLIRQWRV
jgi:hypothetical protein